MLFAVKCITQIYMRINEYGVEMRFIAHTYIVGGNLMQLSMLFVDGDKRGRNGGNKINMKGFSLLNLNFGYIWKISWKL